LIFGIIDPWLELIVMSIVLQKGDMELQIYKFNLKGNNGAEACNSLAVKDSMILMLQTN